MPNTNRGKYRYVNIIVKKINASHLLSEFASMTFLLKNPHGVSSSLGFGSCNATTVAMGASAAADKARTPEWAAQGTAESRALVSD